MELKFIKYLVKERLAIITLNRPDKRNALNDSLIEELTFAFTQVEENENVKVVVFKAEGKSFCAGADLDYLEKLSKFSFKENLNDSIKLKDLLLKIYSLDKIVIAQVQGHAIAGGSGLVSVCDFSFAVPEANFGYTEVKLGFVPAIVALFLVKKIGEGKAKELLLSGKLISADVARDLGLISEVVKEDSLEQTVMTFAEDLVASTSRLSIASTKKLLNNVLSPDLNEKLSIACEANARMRETIDFKKGVSAFLNKESIGWN